MIGIEESIDILKEKGFRKNFLIEEGCLKLRGEERRYEPENFQVRETFRVDVDSSASEQSVVYGLESRKDPVFRGYLTTSYGPEASAEDAKVINALKTTKPLTPQGSESDELESKGAVEDGEMPSPASRNQAAGAGIGKREFGGGK